MDGDSEKTGRKEALSAGSTDEHLEGHRRSLERMFKGHKRGRVVISFNISTEPNVNSSQRSTRRGRLGNYAAFLERET